MQRNSLFTHFFSSLFLACLFSFFFSTLQAQTIEEVWPEWTMSLEGSNLSLFEVLQQIEKTYPVRFYYREEWMPREKMSIQLVDLPLSAVLEQLLESSGLVAYPFREHAIFIGRPSGITQLTRNLSLPVLEEEAESRASLFTTKNKRNVIGDSTLRPLPAKANLRGGIYDRDTDAGLAGVRVVFPELETGAMTDSTGHFELELPTGALRVRMQAPGRETREEIIWLYSEGEWETELAFTAFQLEEVLLQADGAEKNVNEAQSGVVRLSPIEIRKMPNLLGEIDILKSVMMVPGISSVGEAARGFNVRGGNIDQNLVTQEGSIILNSSHLLGFYSLFHPDMVKEVNLFKGHIPAQYGGRIASVLEVKLDEGSYRKVRGRMSIGAVASKFSIGGPIVKDKSSYLIGIRGAYPGLLLNTQQTRPNLLNSGAYYGDVTAKVSQRLGELGTLSANGYVSTDYFSFANEFGFSWSTIMGGLEWKQIYSNRLSSNILVNANQYQSNFFQLEEGAASNIFAGMQQQRFKAGLLYTPEGHSIRVGLDGVNYLTSPNEIRPYNDASSILARSVEKDQGLEMGVYVNDEFDLGNFVGVSLGLRFSTFTNYGPGNIYLYEGRSVPTQGTVQDTISYRAGQAVKRFGGLEPRASLRINLDEKSSVKFGYNRINQYIHLLSNSAAATPVDLWQLSNLYFPTQSADNFFFGLYRNFRANTIQASMEFYYRDLQGQMVNRNFAQLLVNDQVETEVLPADGRAYGGEFSLDVQIRKFDFKLAYVYSRSLQRTPVLPDVPVVNGGAWFPSDFDSPHSVTLSAFWKAKKTVTYSMNFVYRTGRPVTAPIGEYPLDPSFLVPAFSERNQFRIPDYHRLDFSATFDRQMIKRDRVKSEFVFSIYNLYGRNNAFSVFFREGAGGYQAYQLSVLGAMLPMISYNFRF